MLLMLPVALTGIFTYIESERHSEKILLNRTREENVFDDLAVELHTRRINALIYASLN